MASVDFQPFDFQPRTRVVFGAGALARLGELARGLGFARTLVVADRGLAATEHFDHAMRQLCDAGIAAFPFHGFDANPDSEMVEAGRAIAAPLQIDSIVGFGGGSSMDCAKGINFLLTNGGVMPQYQGYGKVSRPLLPSIGIPTTTGTGSEAQSYALISDARTHEKMACGDPSAAFRLALLDPELTVSQPLAVRAVAGYDAISHAVEAYVSTRGSVLSRALAREAWRLLDGNFERVLKTDELDALGMMQIGAHLAGMAIENGMLGATHACANPLTARYGIAHGVAIGLLLSHVVRWNAAPAHHDLHPRLAQRLEDLAAAAALPRRLRDCGVQPEDFDALANEAGGQWTGRFNPRPFDPAAALEIYQCAF